MTAPSPLLDHHRAAGAILLHYGHGEGEGVEVVAAMAPIELEYAMIRRASALLDLPHRGVIEVTGPDRVSFLNRMLTQELKNLPEGSVRRSFWLNRKGRIDSDLRIWHFEDRTLLEMDVLATARTVEGLSSYIVADDVAIREISAATHRLALHGPAAPALAASIADSGSRSAVETLAKDRCVLASLAGCSAVVSREDQTGEAGLELMCSASDARTIYDALLSAGNWNPASPLDARVRPIGWHAFNVARIEGGTPLYNLDFGPDSLPAETGVFGDRVSLTKGCYLGQEIVARMHARGHPKQKLVAIRCARSVPLPAPGEQAPPAPRQPETGSHVFREGSETPGEGPIGAVTSAATSPMLGQVPICFAMVKYEVASAGTGVQVDSEGSRVDGKILEDLRFLAKAAS